MAVRVKGFATLSQSVALGFAAVLGTGAQEPRAQSAASGQQQQQAEQPQLIFSPWVKLCNKDPDPNSKRVCVTVKDGRVE